MTTKQLEKRLKEYEIKRQCEALKAEDCEAKAKALLREAGKHWRKYTKASDKQLALIEKATQEERPRLRT